MQISESSVLIGLIILLVLGISLVVIVSFLNLALGLATLAVYMLVWSLLLCMIYVGMFAYNTVTSNASSTSSSVGDEPIKVTTDNLTPLSDDFLQALDNQLRAQDPEGIEPLFAGDGA
jgi:hypothetical protein